MNKELDKTLAEAGLVLGITDRFREIAHHILILGQDDPRFQEVEAPLLKAWGIFTKVLEDQAKD